jgi:hypothetical protein
MFIVFAYFKFLRDKTSLKVRIEFIVKEIRVKFKVTEHSREMITCTARKLAEKPI